VSTELANPIPVCTVLCTCHTMLHTGPGAGTAALQMQHKCYIGPRKCFAMLNALYSSQLAVPSCSVELSRVLAVPTGRARMYSPQVRITIPPLEHRTQDNSFMHLSYRCTCCAVVGSILLWFQLPTRLEYNPPTPNTMPKPTALPSTCKALSSVEAAFAKYFPGCVW